MKIWEKAGRTGQLAEGILAMLLNALNKFVRISILIELIDLKALNNVIFFDPKRHMVTK